MNCSFFLWIKNLHTSSVEVLQPFLLPAPWRNQPCLILFLKWSFSTYCSLVDVLTHSHSLLCLPKGGTQSSSELSNSQKAMTYHHLSLFTKKKKNTNPSFLAWTKICLELMCNTIKSHWMTYRLPVTSNLINARHPSISKWPSKPSFGDDLCDAKGVKHERTPLCCPSPVSHTTRAPKCSDTY